jgi:hypothetical protein
LPVDATKGICDLIGSLQRLLTIAAHEGDEAFPRFIEAGEYFPPASRKLSLFGEALESGVVKSNNAMNQAFEETCRVE